MLIPILSFIAVLGPLIIIHELGHFITAKRSGVKVLEFAIGFPPRLLRFQCGETVYTLNLLPLGGFVRMLGEEDPSDPRSLAAKSAPVRSLVMSAGALMNLLLALVLFAIVAMLPVKVSSGDVRIAEVADNSPAAMAGLLPDDVIQRVNGRRVENVGDLRYQIQLRLGATTTMEVLRDGAVREIDVIPRWKVPEGEGATGIRVELVDAAVVTRSRPFWEAIPGAGKQTVETLVLMKNGVTRWFIGDASPRDDVAGPIGIARVSGEVARAGIVPLLTLAAVLSLNLAILNILPLPALDGGRLMFVAIEVLRRGKRIAPQKEALVHLTGFAVLIIITVLISYLDILRITRGESVLGG